MKNLKEGLFFMQTVKTKTAEPRRLEVPSEIIKAPKGTTYKIGGREYPVKNYIKTAYGCFPEVEIKMMSDYKWQLMCLNDRLENPDKYRRQGENVEEHIEQLRQWLKEHDYMKGEA